MTFRNNGYVPSPRRVFGAQLRRIRERAGLTQEQLAELISYSYSTVAAIETGRRAPAAGAPEQMDAVLKTGDRLAALAEDLGEGLRLSSVLHPEWFRDWQRMEAEATAMRWYEPLLVPGALQTQAYARAVLRTRAGNTDEEIEEMVAARIESQAILDRPKPPIADCRVRGVLARACCPSGSGPACRAAPRFPPTTAFQVRAGPFMASHPLVNRCQNVAIGLTGLPDVPAKRTGATARWKSHWPSSAAVVAHTSRSQLSSSHRPIATRLTA